MCSTVCTYGVQYDWFPTTEDHPLRPTTDYGRNKAAADAVLLRAFYREGFPVTIIKPSTPYGPRLGLLRQVAWEFAWIDRVRIVKTVLVTGVSRGLGHAIATAFAARGWNTIGVARSACQIPGVRTEQLDVCDEQAVTAFIRSLAKLDVVVNNAGLARYRPLLETPTSELREILEVNVIGAFNVMREAARRMVEQGGGLIINIASDAAVKMLVEPMGM